MQSGGGYSTVKQTSLYPHTTWEGMKKAWSWSKKRGIQINLAEARPSFCSSACYMLLLKALSVWDRDQQSISKSAWVALRPYTVRHMKYKFQNDGVGCWGCANANGPGVAVLVGPFLPEFTPSQPATVPTWSQQWSRQGPGPSRLTQGIPSRGAATRAGVGRRGAGVSRPVANAFCPLRP